jgi:hypothetical protein
MDKRILLVGLLLLISSASSANPRIDLTEALRLAEDYVRDHKIENSSRFLSGVHWDEVIGHPEKSCWSVVWDWSTDDMMMTDARLVVRVCEDGSIRHQDKWA